MSAAPRSDAAVEPTTLPAQRSSDTNAPEQRGRLRIDRAVLRGIAEHVADLECGQIRVHRRIPGSGARGKPRVRLSGPDYALHVRLTMVLRYPDAAIERVQAVRHRVVAELHRQADVSVRNVDITITALIPAEEAPRVR